MAEHAQASRNVLGDASPGADDSASADVHVIGDAGLARDHHVIAGRFPRARPSPSG